MHRCSSTISKQCTTNCFKDDDDDDDGARLLATCADSNRPTIMRQTDDVYAKEFFERSV